MTNHPTEDGSLWAKPVPLARRRRLKVLLIAVGVAAAVILAILQLIAYIHPHTTTNHGQGNVQTTVPGPRATPQHGHGRPDHPRVTLAPI